MGIKLCVIAALALVASTAQAKPLNVFACEPEWAALVQELAGERAKVRSATTALQDAHHVQARPSLIAKARRADALVCTGSELEIGWLPVLLRKSGNKNIQVGAQGHIMVSEWVPRLEIPEVLDRSLGDIHPSGNPHVHLNPNHMLTIAKQLSARLASLDTKHSEHYSERLADFEQRWQAAIKNWEVQAAHLKGVPVMVQHKNWSYLLDWLGVKAVADLEPVPGVPPTSSHLKGLISQAKAKQPLAILIADYQSDKGAQWLSKKTNVSVVSLPFSVDKGESLELWMNRVFAKLLPIKMVTEDSESDSAAKAEPQLN